MSARSLALREKKKKGKAFMSLTGFYCKREVMMGWERHTRGQLTAADPVQLYWGQPPARHLSEV